MPPVPPSGDSLGGFILLALSSLFVIVDPLAAVPAFLAMTDGNTLGERRRMSRTASWVTGLLLVVFALLGKWVFRYLGITMPAFQMAGSVVLLLVALDMVRAQRSKVQETVEETNAGHEKEDIAVTPLAVPMLAGPGAMTTVVLLHARADTLAKQLALLLAIAIVSVSCYVVFSLAARSTRWLNPIALRISTRIMGLFLAAIAFQFLLNALQELHLVPPTVPQ